jgi:capsule polysaccharide export protein KpsE/RkpR
MSGESRSTTQAPSNEEGIVLVPSDNNTGRAEEFPRRLVHERTVANLRLYWVHRKVLLRAGAYALMATTLIAFLIPVRYASVTRLMPPDQLSGTGLGMLSAMAGARGAATGASGGGLGEIAGSLLGMKSSGALFVGIIQSQTVQDRLIEQFDLKKVYRDSKIEDARDDLSKYTDVSEDRKSGIISIEVTDHDPKRAALMARTYVEELDRLVAQVSTSSARRERVFLEGRLTAVKTELDNSARRFSDFASKNSAIDIPAQGKAMVEAAATLQGELIAVQSEIEGLRQIYTDENVRVRSARARMNELQKKLTEIGAAGTGSEDTNGVPALFPSIRKLPILGVTYADLYRQAKIQETVYEMLTAQYEIAKVEEAKEIPSVKVLDAAIVPTKKTFPPRGVIIILGTSLGFALAMIWVAGKSGWESTEPGDLRKEFAREVFTTVRKSLPRFSHNGANGSSNGNLPRAQWKEADGPNDAEPEDDKIDP